MAPQRKFGAVIFDTFGTLVDRHSAVAREVSRLLANNHALDVDAFATDWNARIQSSMKPVRDGERAWVNIDKLEAETLEDVLADFGVVTDASTKKKLVQAWHQLDAWPEVPEALKRIRKTHLIAPVSNGHVRIMVDLARRNGIVWDAIFGAEFSHDYKPKAAVYRDAVAGFGFPVEETLFVAAHSTDIAGALAACPGIATAHVSRPKNQGDDTELSVPVDFVADDLADLATQLGSGTFAPGGREEL